MKNFTFLLPVGIFITSVFITILFWLALPGDLGINENDDYIGFEEPLARNILAGRGFICRDGILAVRKPPGHSLILAGIFWLSDLLNLPEDMVLSVFILICMSLSSVVLFYLAQSVWGPLPALISSAVWMTYPFALWLTKQPNNENPFLVFFYGSFCLLWYALRHKSHNWWIYFLSGLLLGFAMLIRSIAIGVGIVMGIIIWLTGYDMRVRLRIFLIAAILLGNLVALFPWERWVYSRTNRIATISTEGVASMRDGLRFAAVEKSWRKGVKVPQDVAALMKDADAHFDELGSLGDIISFIARKLQSRPLAVTKLFFIKAARSWYGTNSNRFEAQIILIQIVYLVLILCSSIAVWRQGGIARRLAISIWLITLYFWGMTISVLSILRYMTPVMGLLFVLVPGLFFKPRSFEDKAISK